MRFQNTAFRPPRWLILVLPALLFTIPFLVLHPGTFASIRNSGSLLIDTLKTAYAQPEAHPAPLPKYNDWVSQSNFDPVSIDDPANKSIVELCQGFPTYMLEEIQPILKTGHGVLRERLRSQFQGSAACLSNLLIFSDLEEEFKGHQIIDVIADIPVVEQNLSHWGPHSRKHKDQLASYQALQDFAANGTLDFANTSALEGWKTDKFKFLSSISRAWHMRPERRWYLFFEDDTYVLWDNIFRFLQHFNPDAAWYFGSPTDGRRPHKGEKKTRFAYGGTGFLLSREAMRQLVENDTNPDTGAYLGTQLTANWWDPEIVTNCCGDSVLGWVMWNLKIPLLGVWPMFSPAAPYKTAFSPEYWCKPVMTMHKPTAEDLAGLWRWEWEHRQPDVSLPRVMIYASCIIS